VQETVWLGDVPVATLRPKSGSVTTPIAVDVFYVHADHLGTPRVITRPSDNKIVWKWDSTEAFGNSLPNENPSALGAFKYNLRMPGQYFDQETGTFYNYFRDYDPSLGRYVQSDPIGLAGGASTFEYVGSSPLAFFDPFGLDPVIPNPTNVPGGPWTPHDANRPGQFLGPKPSDGRGGRPQCQYVPPEGEGGPPGSRGYWKTNQPGQSGWQRYNFEGKPITAQEAHRIPTPRPPGNNGGAIPPPAIGIGAATAMVGILALITPGNAGQCKNPCECGEMCPKPASGAPQ
jgi:RHS repeat-associated protein